MVLKAGDIIEGYPYLWLRQSRAGETEGRKPRPVCVAIAVVGEDNKTHLALLPISSQPPMTNQIAIPIPARERQRIGLDVDKEAWIYVSEYNYDVLGESYYLPAKPKSAGSVSAALLKELLSAFRVTLQKKAGRVLRG
jgi:hypothetical protein